MTAEGTSIRMDQPAQGLLDAVADPDVPEVDGLAVGAPVVKQRIQYRFRPPLMVW
jgi:hypothetical protein